MMRLAKLLRRPSFYGWLILLLCFIAFGAVRACGPVVPTVTTMRRDLEQHIVASGRVLPPSRVSVASMVPGLVMAVAVVEGQHVTSGDLLVQLNDSEARSQLAQAQAAVSQATAKVEQLRRVGAIVASQSLLQAQSNLARLRADLERAEKLAETGAVSRVELDNARREVEVAQAQKNGAEAQQLGTLGADSRVAMSALLQAQAQETAARVRLSQTKLTAVRSGTILSRDVEPGDTIQPARPLLVLASDGAVELVFQADERNLGSLALGQQAHASADAFPQQPFDAEVHYVAPSIDPERGTVELRLRVKQPQSFLKPDMTVSIDLTVAKRQAVLVVPSEAVRGVATEKPFVFAVEDHRVVPHDVTLGIRGEGAIEILQGLSEGAELIVPDGQRIVAGQRVRSAPMER